MASRSIVPIQPAMPAPRRSDDLLAGAGQQEGDADAGQRRVRQRVAQQPLAAQDGEGAEDAADDPEQRRAERDVAQGVVEDQVAQQVAHTRASISSSPLGRGLLRRRAGRGGACGRRRCWPGSPG